MVSGGVILLLAARRAWPRHSRAIALPGRIKTDRLQTRFRTLAEAEGISPAAAEERMIAEAGVARFGEPEEIADLVAYLVSPRGRFFQGSLIDMDGGETKGF